VAEGAGDDSGPATGEKPGESPVHAGPRKASYADFLAELKRRRVFRVMVGYGIFAFAVLQVIEPIMHGAGLPDWVLKAALVALAVGFPVALILAWFFDLTAQGVIRTSATSGVRGIYFSRGRLAVLLVVVGLLGALPGIGWYFWKQAGERGVGEAPAGTPSIAVLPFDDLSPGHDQGYFADGVAEEILNALAHVKGLKVIGATSAFAVRGQAGDPRAIGERFDVGHVLVGSLRRDGDQVRVTARLLKVADGSTAWSERFNRKVTALLEVQDDIAREVVEALKSQLSPGSSAPAVVAATASPEAYRLVLLGRDELRQLTAAANARAVTAFRAALALDPAYAPAWAGLALGQRRAYGLYSDEDRPDIGAEAVSAADRAVALAPALSEAWWVRSEVNRYVRCDFAGALADAERAVSLAPVDSAALLAKGLALAANGRLPEGVAAAARATEVDPLAVDAWARLAQLRIFAGDLPGADAALARAGEASPGNAMVGYISVAVRIAQGHPAEALAVAERSEFAWVKHLGRAMALHDLGREAEAREAAQALVAKVRGYSDYQIAMAYAHLGDRDAALDWLERDIATKDSNLAFLPVDPLFKPLRDMPRFRALLAKVNQPRP